MIQCFILPLNHPIGVAVVVWVQPDSLLVESGRVTDSGLMAFYGYLAEDTRLSQRRTLILANMQSLAWWNVCFKNARHDECLGRTVGGITGRLDSSLPLLARAHGRSCGRSVVQEGSPSKKPIRFLAGTYGGGWGAQASSYMIGGRRLVLKHCRHLWLLSFSVWSLSEVPALYASRESWNEANQPLACHC